MARQRYLVIHLAAVLLCDCRGGLVSGPNDIDADADVFVTDSDDGMSGDAAHPVDVPDEDVDLPDGPNAGVIAAMPHGSWKRLAGTTMSQVCPGSVDHYACDAVMNAWSGAAYDQARERLVVMGGGHSDSFVNNVFGFDVLQGTWKRWSELPAPLEHSDSGPFPSAFADARIETCGLYPSVSTLSIDPAWLTGSGYLMHEHCDDPDIVEQLDPQQPRSAHTYGNLAVSNGRFYVLGSIAMFQSGQSASPRVSAFDFETKQWTRGPDNVYVFYGASAVDDRGRIFYIGNRAVAALDPTAGAWTKLPNTDDASGYYAGAAIDSTRNRLVITADGAGLATWNLATFVYTAVAASGLADSLAPSPGFEYAPDVDRFYAWNGGVNLFVLNPETFTWSQIVGTGDDPGPRAQWGTFGRFRYSVRMRIFVAVSSTTGDVYLFKP